MVYFRTTAVSDCSAAKKNGRRSKERKNIHSRGRKRNKKSMKATKKRKKKIFE